MITTSDISGRGQITIPSEIRKKLKLSSGDRVVITETDNTVQIKPIRAVSDIMQLFGSVKPENKKLSIENAIKKAKKQKAEKTIQQEYE